MKDEKEGVSVLPSAFILLPSWEWYIRTHPFSGVNVGGARMETRRKGKLKALSPRQQDVIDTYVRLWCEQGIPPVIRQIQEAMAIKSPNAVMGHYRALARKGWLLPPAREGRYGAWVLSPNAVRKCWEMAASEGKVVVRLFLPEVVLSPREAFALARELVAAARRTREARHG